MVLLPAITIRELDEELSDSVEEREYPVPKGAAELELEAITTGVLDVTAELVELRLVDRESVVEFNVVLP